MILSKNLTYFPYREIDLLVVDPSIRVKLSKILSFGIDLILTLITRGKLAFTDQGRKFISAVNDADVVIHAPGGWIGDYIGKSRLGDIPYLYRLLIPILKSKPIFFYAVSMGPFSGSLMNLIRKFIFRRAKAIIVRGEFSSKYLKEQLDVNSYVTTDSVFQNDIPEDQLSTYSCLHGILNEINRQKVIGIAITDLKWHPKYKNDSTLGKRITVSFSKAAKYLISKGYVILLIPMTFGDPEEETSLLENIRRLNKKKIFILPPNVDSYAEQVVISKLFCIISMRYHPCVFAAKGNVPFIAVSYKEATESLMENLEYPDLMLSVKELSADKIVEKFIHLEENYDAIKEHLQKKYRQLREKSRKTTEIIQSELRTMGVIQ